MHQPCTNYSLENGLNGKCKTFSSLAVEINVPASIDTVSDLLRVWQETKTSLFVQKLEVAPCMAHEPGGGINVRCDDTKY